MELVPVPVGAPQAGDSAAAAPAAPVQNSLAPAAAAGPGASLQLSALEAPPVPQGGTIPAPESRPAAVDCGSPGPATPGSPPDTAAPAPSSAPPIDTGPQLVVSLAGALYAIPIGGIEEIVPMREVAPLPRSAPAVRGILFLRGQPVTVLDLGVLLGSPPVRGTRIVVLVVDDERYGLVVDAVLKVASPGSLTDLVPPPAVLRASPALRGVARLGDEIVSLLDVERLIPAPAAARAGP